MSYIMSNAYVPFCENGAAANKPQARQGFDAAKKCLGLNHKRRDCAMNATEVIVRCISGLVFAFLGYFIAYRIPRQSKITLFVIFILAVLLSSDILPNLLIMAVDQYAIYFNSALYGLSVGILMAFLVRGKYEFPRPEIQNHSSADQ